MTAGRSNRLSASAAAVTLALLADDHCALRSIRHRGERRLPAEVAPAVASSRELRHDLAQILAER